MFTDIEGYTALMQESEASAISVRSRHREVFEYVTDKYQGKIIHYYGDGTLSIFDSAVVAVQCAVEMQKKFQEAPLIPVRIGIHVGDIVVTEDDIIGDAVNLASRIESLAISGSVLVSDKIVEELQNHKDLPVKSLGRFHFKNDKKPREVFAIADTALAIPKRNQLKGKTVDKPAIGKTAIAYIGIAWIAVQILSFLIEKNNLDPALLDLIIIIGAFGFSATLIFTWLRRRLAWKPVLLQSSNLIVALVVIVSYVMNPTRLEPSKLRILNAFEHSKKSKAESLKSIAVLPFSNYTGEKTQEWLYAGMHDGLINEIGQLASIRVIPKTSMLTYLNTTKNMKQIANELDVDGIIEASLTRIDSLIQFRIKLVSVFPKEEAVWSHEFTMTDGEIPNLYKEVTKNVALKIIGVLQPHEIELLTKTKDIKPGAYEAYLKGQYYTGLLTPEGFETALNYYQIAIEIDPEFAEAYGGIAGVWGSMKQMRVVSTAEANQKIHEFLSRAMELDSLSSEMWMGRGATLTWTDYDWEGGEKAFQRSIELNPNKALTRAMYAHLLMILNRLDEARVQMDHAQSLDPQDPWVLSFSGVVYATEGKVLSAFKQFEKLKKLEPDHPMLNFYLLNKYAVSFQYDKAIEQLKKSIYLRDNKEIHQLIDETYQRTDFQTTVKTLATALEEIRKTEFVSPMTILALYDMLGDKGKRLYWLNQLYQTKDPNLPYFAIRTNDPIQDDPAYIAIMKDIGLW